MDSDSVASAMVQFDGYLSQPDGHNLPQFSLLSSPIIRDKIIKKVFLIDVVSIYMIIYYLILRNKKFFKKLIYDPRVEN